MEVLIRMNPDTSESFQQQIVDQIIGLIKEKHALPGVRLPSSRALSEQHKLSSKTVNGAYK